MKNIKTFGSFINESDENIDDYEITTNNEIEGRPCVDFNPTELHPNDIIYRKLVDVVNYRSNWYKHKNNIPNIDDLSSYSKPEGFKVISNDGKILKLEDKGFINKV
jgi:hypothetical protein